MKKALFVVLAIIVGLWLYCYMRTGSVLGATVWFGCYSFVLLIFLTALQFWKKILW